MAMTRLDYQNAAAETLALAREVGIDQHPASDTPAADYPHLLDMCERMVGDDGMSLEKLGRWLGWMQGCVYVKTDGTTSLDDFKAINMRNSDNARKGEAPAVAVPVAPKEHVAVNEYAANYYFAGEGGDYTPTEGERAMIEDAINGYLAQAGVQTASPKLPALDEIAKAINGPHRPLHEGSHWTLAEVRDARWSLVSEMERLLCEAQARSVLALFDTPKAASLTVIFDSLGSRLHRTPYLVVPRLALEAMPVEWQRDFEGLLKAADDAGLVTPAYHVLRDDPEFTHAERNDPEDPASDLRFFTINRPDPWADYRHGDAMKLSKAARA